MNLTHQSDMNKALEFAAKYQICNAHTHIYPPKIADKAVVNIGRFYELEMDCEVGTSECLIKDGKAFGVEKYLVCSAATDPNQVESINRFVAGECSKHPEFLGFGTLHPDYEDIDAEVKRCMDSGLRGIKLHPDFQKFNIDDEKAMSIYKACQGKIPVLFHMGDARYDFSSPQRLAKVLNEFPQLDAFGAHLGGYSAWDKADKFLHGFDHLYFDCSSSLAFMTPERACELIHGFGTDKIFFGTDFPMWNHLGEIIRFMELGLTDDENKAILAGNFKKYFNIQ